MDLPKNVTPKKRDSGILPVHYLLQSTVGGPTFVAGWEACAQADDLVRNMNEHLNHEVFMTGFELDVDDFEYEEQVDDPD